MVSPWISILPVDPSVAEGLARLRPDAGLNAGGAATARSVLRAPTCWRWPRPISPGALAAAKRLMRQAGSLTWAADRWSAANFWTLRNLLVTEANRILLGVNIDPSPPHRQARGIVTGPGQGGAGSRCRRHDGIIVHLRVIAGISRSAMCALS